MIAQEAATTARWAFGGVDSALSRARRGEDGGKATVKVKTKGGGEGQKGGTGVRGSVCVEEAAAVTMAGRGRWRRARWERQWRRRRRCVGGERQSGNINFLTQVVAGGGEGEHLKTKKRGVEKCGKDEEKGEWWWLKRKVPIGKVRRAQRGLGPRLRVARRTVGAKA